MRRIATLMILLFTIYVIYITFSMYLECQVTLKYEEALTEKVMIVLNYVKLVFIYIVTIIAFYFFDRFYLNKIDK